MRRGRPRKTRTASTRRGRATYPPASSTGGTGQRGRRGRNKNREVGDAGGRRVAGRAEAWAGAAPDGEGVPDGNLGRAQLRAVSVRAAVLAPRMAAACAVR